MEKIFPTHKTDKRLILRIYEKKKKTYQLKGRQSYKK